jgi:GNAT superfamily N-acetyltransferase
MDFVGSRTYIFERAYARSDTVTASAPLTLEWSENPNDLQVLQYQLLKEIEVAFGPPQRENFLFVLRATDDTAQGTTKGTVQGGVGGYVHWNWVYVGQLWVASGYQGQGQGKRLMRHLEKWARERKSQGIYIDTFDPKVRAFYESLGYHCIGAIPHFPQGHQRFFLYRSLDGANL